MSWRKLRPYGNRVLVKLDGRASHQGLIEIPDDYREQPVTATVVAVGPGVMQAGGVLHRVMIEPGQRVAVGKYNGVEIPAPDDDPGGSYWICDCSQLFSRTGRESDIYGLVEER